MNRIVGYPSIRDRLFYNAIRYDSRYCLGPPQLEKFRLMEQQQQFPMYFNPLTGIRSALLFHEVGSGKTITIILTALKHRGEKPALILVPNESILREFRCEILGREWIGSGDAPRSVFRRKCTGDAFINAEMRDILNNMPSERAKDRLVAKIWAERVAPFFEFLTHTRFYNLILGSRNNAPMRRADINATFGDRFIAVDECQAMRKEKRLYQSVERLPRGLLLFSSATPMIESAHELCPLVNLMLKNDGFNERLEPKHIDKNNTEFIRKCLRGRISYVRGLDPRTFPLREDHGEHLFPHLPDHRVWPCYMVGRQLKAYLENFMVEFDPQSDAGQRCDVWNHTREKGRCHLLPNMGRKGNAKWIGNAQNPNWKLENMHDLSCKNVEMDYIANTLFPNDGLVMVYCANVETGVNSNETFWRANGVRHWTDKGSGPAFVNLSGESATNATANRAIKVLKSDRNYKSRQIRYALVSPKVSTGLTFRHGSVCIITEVGWTRGEMEQVFGRLTRNSSHVHCTDRLANNVVHTFVLCARIRPEDIAAIDDVIFQRRFAEWFEMHFESLDARGFIGKHGNLRTIDERTLDIAMQREIQIAKMTRLMKEMAVPLNTEQNYFKEEGTRYAKKRLYDYLTDPPTIPVPTEFEPTPASKYRSATTEECYHDWESADAWWNEITDQRGDFFGHIALSLEEAFRDRNGWILEELLQLVAQKSGVSQTDVMITLSHSEDFIVNYESGWIYRSGSTQSQCLLELWQSNPGIDNPFAVVDEPCGGLGHFMKDHVSLDDIFGKVEPNIRSIPVGIRNDLDMVQSDGNGTLCLRRTGWCGVFDNTADNPDEFKLKIVTYSNGSKFKKVHTKMSADSKSIDHLVALVDELDGDVDRIIDSSGKIEEACEVLTERLILIDRLLPWMINKPPSLYRILCVARQWNLKRIVCAINDFVVQLLESGTFAGLCKHLFDLRAANSYHNTLPMERVVQQLQEKCATNADYVLRMIDRISGNRPKRMKNIAQWNAAKEWIITYVSVPTQRFRQELDQEFVRRATAASSPPRRKHQTKRPRRGI